MTSRFITYPDVVESTDNQPVALIDASEYNIEDIGLFCKMSKKDFDIYLYRAELDDLQWLNEISNRVVKILLSGDSKVSISPGTDVIKFGEGQELVNPLEYFQQQEQNGI